MPLTILARKPRNPQFPQEAELILVDRGVAYTCGRFVVGTATRHSLSKGEWFWGHYFATYAEAEWYFDHYRLGQPVPPLPTESRR